MRPADTAPFKATEDIVLGRGQAAFLYGGVFLISCAVILFEICVLRIFSVLFLNHFAFAIVSIAVLGLGLGGIAVSVYDKQRVLTLKLFTKLSYLSNSFAFLLILFIVAASFLPTLNFKVYMFFLLVPFIVGGIVTSSAFGQCTTRLHGIYCFNLLGSAVGAVAVLTVLNWFGGPNAIAFAGVLASLAALMFAVAADSVRRMIIPSIIFLVVFANFLVSVMAPYLPSMPINTNADKEIARLERDGAGRSHVLETRWSAFGRTDLIEFENNPLDKHIFIDGTSGTSMFIMDNLTREASRPDFANLKSGFLGAFPYQSLGEKNKESALIIGPGGGRDVLVALLNGVQHITAVDVNPDLIDIVKKYSSFNGDIYERPNVDVVAEEGRAFLRRSDKKYDQIVLPLTVVKTSRSAEGYMLTENYLYTTDAITDYLAHVADDGQLIFLLHGRGETYRLMSILLPVLKKSESTVEQAMNHLYVLGHDKMTLLVVKKKAFAPNEIASRYAMANKWKAFDGPAKDRVAFFPYLSATAQQLAAAAGSKPVFAYPPATAQKGAGEGTKPVFPGLSPTGQQVGGGGLNPAFLGLSSTGQQFGGVSLNAAFSNLLATGQQVAVEGPKPASVMDNGLMQLYAGNDLSRWLRATGLDSQLVTDNRPFFYNLDGRPPDTLKNLLYTSLYILAGSVFVPPLVASLWRRKSARHAADDTKKKRGKERPAWARFSLRQHWRYIAIFTFLGAGFMMTEMALIQKFILFLGQPVVSLSVLLLSLFIGMGVGGVGVKYLAKPTGHKRIRLVIVVLVGLVFAYTWLLLPDIFTRYLGSTLLVKMLISIALIVPLGVVMGMPCPYMLSMLKATSREAIIPWMWGINGVSSVCGSMLAVTLGIVYGFDEVLVIGMLLYVGILVCLKRERPTSASSQATVAAKPKLRVSLAALSDGDKAAIVRQRVCPVTGAKLGSMGDPVKVLIGNQPLYLCCQRFVAKLKNDPETYLAKVGQSHQSY